MKFENFSYFFKHKNCMDVFFFVDVVVQDTGEVAIIYGNWMTQGVEHYWEASNRERLFIKRDQYENWVPYTPSGKYLYG